MYLLPRHPVSFKPCWKPRASERRPFSSGFPSGQKLCGSCWRDVSLVLARWANSPGKSAKIRPGRLLQLRGQLILLVDRQPCADDHVAVQTFGTPAGFEGPQEGLVMVLLASSLSARGIRAGHHPEQPEDRNLGFPGPCSWWSLWCVNQPIPAWRTYSASVSASSARPGASTLCAGLSSGGAVFLLAIFGPAHRGFWATSWVCQNYCRF